MPCAVCRHRRHADRSALDEVATTSLGSRARGALNRQRNEVLTQMRLEDLAYSRVQGGSLGHRPMTHDWCEARSDVAQGAFFFVDWLGSDVCPLFEPSDLVRSEGTSGRQDGATTTTDARAPGDRVRPAGPVSPERSAHPVAERADGSEPSREGWRLPLGRAYALRPCSTQLPELAGGGFSLDFRLHETGESPSVTGKGLTQTYLIFGGPGAGKTYYFKYLLSSLLEHESRPGCLLLDPKGALTPWLDETLDRLGRKGDLVVLDGDPNREKTPFNALGDDLLPPQEMGRLLTEIILASAPGVEDWGVLVADLLQSAAVVLYARNGHLTARDLLSSVLYPRAYRYADGGTRVLRPIEVYAERIATTKANQDPLVRISADRLLEFFRTTDDRQRRFVRQIIEMAVGELASPRWAFLSDPHASPPYADIIHKGRVVTVAVGQASPTFQGALSSLIKALFQQAVLGDLTARPADALVARPPAGRAERFFILACDEYAQAITEGESGLVSDSRFFSLSREAGCLSLLALQSVATGRSRFPASMHDRWNGIMGNVTVKLFMRLNDTETAELGSALAGSQHSFIPVVSQQQSAQGLSATEAVTMVEHRRVPPWYLTNCMEQGVALVHGTLDGVSVPTTIFVRAPSPEEQQQLREERTRRGASLA